MGTYVGLVVIVGMQIAWVQYRKPTSREKLRAGGAHRPGRSGKPSYTGKVYFYVRGVRCVSSL